MTQADSPIQNWWTDLQLLKLIESQIPFVIPRSFLDAIL